MENLRISLVQSYLHWQDIPTNLQHFGEKLQALAGYTDLVILPEMFTTGFSMQAELLAEKMGGSTTKWMQQQAKLLDAAVMGSFIVREDKQFYNRLVFMRPDGTYECYDKRHLFTLAKEQETYTAGTQHLIVSWKGWRICPLICYDLRFPVWSRNTVEYDLLVYVANWPTMRREAWNALLIARAIENQAYTVGVNRVGKDGLDYPYAGDSALIDYSGQVLSRFTQIENIGTFSLTHQAQQDFRTKLSFLADQDDFTLAI